MDEDRIQKEVLNLKAKGECPDRRPESMCEQQVRKDVK
jgi:hypothetical protein